MHLFYTPELAPQHKHFMLNEEESKHAIRVLRLVAGDKVCLIDGRGGWYDAVILDPHPKRTTLNIEAVKEALNTSSYQLHIAVAPTKNIDRMEWFLEKATEIGIQEITPIICEHSERKEVKLDRLNKVLVAAMKQSLKAYMPKINPAISLQQFFKAQADSSAQKAIAHCVEADKQYANQVFKAQGNYLLLIGPEGDFSEKEIEQAIALGYAPLTLGSSRLRTETAAITSCIEVALLNR